MPKQSRRSFTTEQKVAILRRHLMDKVPVSDLCEEYKLQPSVLYHWQKQLGVLRYGAFNWIRLWLLDLKPSPVDRLLDSTDSLERYLSFMTSFLT